MTSRQKLHFAPGVPGEKITDAATYVAETNALRLPKIRRQIDHIINNEFYGPQLRAAGVKNSADIRTMDDFRRMPAMMTKAQHRQTQADSLEKYGHPFGLHLCTAPENVIHVAGTSGTTGLPTFYLFTRKDLALTAKVQGRMFEMAGVRKGDLSLHLFGLSLWLAGNTIVNSLESYGACPIPLGAEAGVSKALQYIKLCRPRVVCGTPSIISYLMRRAPEELGQPLSELGVEIVISGGEPGLAIPEFRQRMKVETGARVFDFSSGAWLNAAMACDGPIHTGQHYLAEDYCFRYDLVDPVTKMPIELVDGAIGEAIHTTLDYDAAPAFRYATGDILKLHIGECPQCGQFGARFHFVGRADDLMNIAGVKVYPTAVKEIIESFAPKVTGLMQIILSQPLPKVQPPLCLEVEASPDLSDNLYNEIASLITGKLHAMLKIRANVKVMPFDSLEKSNLKTKLFRMQA